MSSYLVTEEMAERYRTSPATIRYWQHVGYGPRSIKVGQPAPLGTRRSGTLRRRATSGRPANGGVSAARGTGPPREERPQGEPVSQGATDLTSSTGLTVLADLDAIADHHRGCLVVPVEVDDDHGRTHLYHSAAAAERTVKPARDRGKLAHITLDQLVPVGVVVLDALGGVA